MPMFLKEALANFCLRYNKCRHNYLRQKQDIKQSTKSSRIQAHLQFLAEFKHMDERKKLIRKLKRGHPLFMEYLTYFREQHLEMIDYRARTRRALDRHEARRLRKIWKRHKHDVHDLCCSLIRCYRYFC